MIDVALRYGYDSPTAFARAFKRVHGISPSEAKYGGVKLASYPRLVFTLSVKGEEPMDYKIVEKPAFRVVGVPSTGEWELEDAGEKAVQYWVDVEPPSRCAAWSIGWGAGGSARRAVLPRRRIRRLYGMRGYAGALPGRHGGARCSGGDPTPSSSARVTFRPLWASCGIAC